MEELQLALTAARVEQRNFGLWISNWQVGQTLNALVADRLPSGELLLRIAGQQITATADIPIQPGAQLMLEVKALRPVPTLRVLNPLAHSADAEGARPLLTATRALASTPLAAVLQTLHALPLSHAAPASLRQSIDELRRQLPRAERVSTAEGLAAAVQRSGVYLEAGLAAERAGRPSSAPADFKAGLFRALARVDGALAKLAALHLPAADIEALLEMKAELEAGLGRVVAHQLASQPAPGARHWQVEIPVLLADQYHSLQLGIERDARGDGAHAEAEEVWRVKADLELPALGALRLTLALAAQRVDLRIAAEQALARSLIDAALPELGRALQRRGLQLRASAADVLERPAPEPVIPGARPARLDLRA